MRANLTATPAERPVPLIPLTKTGFPAWRNAQSEAWRRWLDSTGFEAAPDSHALLPGADGTLAAVVVGIGDERETGDPWSLAGLPGKLPAHDYLLDGDWTAAERARAALGWGLACYRFDRYKDARPPRARLAPGSEREPVDLDEVARQLDAIGLVRDLINTPAEDMMPEQLAAVAGQLAAEFDAGLRQVVGDQLLGENYPVIHLVGRASAHPPRLLDLRWTPPGHGGPEAGLPLLTLVGKGVCFDSGGLDLKPANGMRLMKKDMGGAAHALGLARLVMAAKLPVRLRLLVAAVENAVSGNAFRPGDIVRSRKGVSIEIDNTDAEGRLILCDALTDAVAEHPDLVVDFATLTGAARVALGTEVPALFCNNAEVAGGLLESAGAVADPVWRLPLHRPYRTLLDSTVADIVNSASAPFGGAITAALFLQEFIPDDVPWAHFDLMAWNSRARPGRPEGGEAMGLRAVYGYLQRRYRNAAGR